MSTNPDALSLAPVAPAQPARSFVARYAFALLLTGFVCSAFSPIFVRLAETGPVATAAGRMLLPLPFFFVLLWLRRDDRLPTHTKAGRRDVWLIVLSGIFFAGDLVLWNSSIMMTTVAKASVLANITPVFIVFGAWLLFRERPRPLFIAGTAVALAGSALIMREGLIATGNTGPGALAGDLSAIGAAAFYSGYVLTLSRVRKRASIVATMAIGGATAGAILFGLAWLVEDQMWPRTADGWLIHFGMVLFVQIGGHMLIAMSLAHVSAGVVATLFLAQPLIPGLAAWLMFGEIITVTQAIGGAALLAGLEISRRGTRPKS
jgi:drug/metabolite transporter (DMT)-like permease